MKLFNGTKFYLIVMFAMFSSSVYAQETQVEPAATAPIATQSEPAATAPIATQSEPAATAPVATQPDSAAPAPVATQPAAAAIPTPQEDQIITDSIKNQITSSAVLSKLDINVQTNQGIVMLSGNVDADSQASVVVELAQSVIGVRDVDASNLKVKASQQPFADMMITAKIKGLMIREDVFGTRDIASVNMSVETKDGVVYLTGAVNNQEQIKNAIKLIEGVKGVKKVEYKLQQITPVITTTTTPPPAAQ